MTIKQIDKSRADSIISESGWLAETDPGFRRAVLSNCQLRSIDQGLNLYIEGNEARGLYGLVQGSLKILISPSTEGPMIGHIAQPGQWIGEYAFITGQVRLLGVSAAAPVATFLYLPASALEQILAKTPGNWRWVALLTAANEKLAISIAANLLIRDSYQRLCKLLMGMVADGRDTSASSTIYCTHGELAEMSNFPA